MSVDQHPPAAGPAEPRIHLLTQYLWPDDAPTGIYMEQVADALLQRGRSAVLVAGPGSYRPGSRPPPAAPLHRLQARAGTRGNLVSTAWEYLSVHRAFLLYIRTFVQPGDVVVVNSAPPSTPFLLRSIRSRGAVSVYWLQDYYPELIRGLWDPPRPIRRFLHKIWDQALVRWDLVVKAAANLAYTGSNSRVIRNWNTLNPGEPTAATPRTALYSGNLGYGHDLDAFIRLCADLRDRGYTITVRGDGPGMSKLPGWIRTEPPISAPEALRVSYWEAELHLIAADPDITGAVFPSKLWNSLAVGRPIECSGFAGPMAEELACSLRANFRSHLAEWVDLLENLQERSAEGRE